MSLRTLAPLVAFRSLLFLSPLPHILRNNAQLSSPLTSYSRLQEGVYLFKNGVDPYSGDIFRQSPLYLSLFSTVLPLSFIASPILWTLCDIIGAWCIVQVWRLRSRTRDLYRESLIWAVYLLNPYLFLPTLALSTSTLDNLFYSVTLYLAASGQSSALLTHAFLTCNSLPSILLTPPLIMVLLAGPSSLQSKSSKISIRNALLLAAEYLVYLAALCLLSTYVTGNWQWMQNTWGAVFSLPDFSPNPGLWWYFFTEMFDHFRPFFLMTFSIHLLIYVAPICIKFQHDPLFATFLLQGILATFKSYPTLSDPGLYISVLSIFPEIYPYLRHPLPSAMWHLHAALLLPLFHHLWLEQGTGNANFFYASTLVFGVANGAVLLDVIYAGLRMGIGPKREGWEIAQI